MKSLYLKIAFFGLLGLGLGGSLRAAVVLSNLDQLFLGGSPLTTGYWFGSRFVTSSAGAFALQSVTLSLGNSLDTTSGLFVAVFSDDALHPGVQLEALSGVSSPASSGDYTYTSSGLSLGANTSYWIVAGVAVGAGNYAWDVTGSNSFTGSWTIPATATHTHSSNQGGQWDAATDGFPRQFSISATAVPEPSTCALVALGVGAGILWRRRR